MNWKNYKKIQVNPSQLLVLVFAVGIVIGTILLKIPTASSGSVSWLDALFTATSAMTVTGLAVVDTGKDFTIVGQLIIVSLIQLGGLGIMTFAVIIFVALGRKIGIKERLIMQYALNQTSIGGVIKLVRSLFIYSITIELVAMLFLAIKWVPEYGWLKGFYYSFFHSISAFNNAGFSIWSDNLMGYAGDPVVNIVISLLFMIGGIGFTVLVDIWNKKNFRRLSVHSKLMIVGTVILNVTATLIIFGIEFNNSNTLGPMSLGDKWWAAYFQAVSPRTAGFNSIDIGSMDETSILLMLLLMFIGAGSASTGGGIKLTTFIVILLAVYTFLKEKKHIVVGRKSIKESVVIKALAIFTISFLSVFLAFFTLTMTERQPLITLLFEVVSAFGTVGLSMGITADLSIIGKIVIITTMCLGKLGPLTLVFSLAKPDQTKLKYPSEDILTG